MLTRPATPLFEGAQALRQRFQLASRISPRSAVLVVALTNLALWTGISVVVWRFW
jgi:hypothetical protein